MPSDWSETALKNAVDNGILEGYDGKISPNSNLTRAQMAAVINRAFGATTQGLLKGYTDVKPDAWYYNDMAAAVGMKVFLGDGSKLYPETNITREEAFVVLARAFKLSGAKETELLKYSDGGQISSWAKEGVSSLVSAGYVQGSASKIQPQQYITRAEFAQIMDNLVQHYIKAAGTYTKDLTGNVVINVPNVTLKNIEISGDLIIGDGVGDGDVILDGVTVTGRTVVRGGGVNSIKVIGSSNLQNIVIARVDGKVRVYADNGAEIGDVTVDGSDDVTIEGFQGNVTVTAPNVTVMATGARITSAVISGENSVVIVNTNSSIQKATIDADKAAIITMTGARVENVTVNGDGASISGKGTVGTVYANANNVLVSTPGTEVKAGEGTTGVTAGDKQVTGGNSDTTPKESVGGGGGDSSTIPVTSISVAGVGNATTVANGGTLQMSATALPSNASNKDITWTVETLLGGTATINATGLLSATGVGTVKVIAKNAASGVSGILTITILDPDVMSIATAKTTIEAAAFTMTQAAATDEAAVLAAIEAKLGTLTLNGVTTSVTKVSYTAATAGTLGAPAGTNGTYQFTVGLTKDAATGTTTTLSMTITATPFDYIAAAKTTIEAANYTMTQAAATDEAAVLAAVEAKLGTLTLNGVTTSVTKVSYTAATAGTLGAPAGTNGTYQFTVGLTKDAATGTTATLSMTVTATPFITEDGSVAHPFQIDTIEELAKVGSGTDSWALDKCYILMNNLDFTADASYSDPAALAGSDINGNGTIESIKTELTTGKGWKPIGTENYSYDESVAFTGNFDGDAHTITGLYVNRPSEGFLGLFGAVCNSGTVKNLGLLAGSISGSETVGGLVGLTYNNAKISACYADVTVTATSTQCGGLVGADNDWNDNGGSIIKYSYAIGNVTGASNTGGLMGYACNTTIKGCYATGSVSGSTYSGGLIGDCYAYHAVGDSDMSIKNCYATGNVSSNHYGVGGLVGRVTAGSETTGMVDGCYAAGTVTANGENSINVAGLIGEAASVTVSNCIAYNSTIFCYPYYGGSSDLSRVIGKVTSVTMTNNYAKASMVVSFGTTTLTFAAGAGTKCGADISSLTGTTTNPMTSWNIGSDSDSDYIYWSVESGAARPVLYVDPDENGSFVKLGSDSGL